MCVVLSFILFWIHLNLMPNVGFGDRYMTPDFRQHSLPRRIVELVAAMYRYNRDLGFTHPYQSKWYEWPFFIASPTVLHRSQKAGLLCIFNNPVIAVMSFIGFIVGLGSWNFQYSMGYFAAYAPFILVTRCMWTYHYEIALFFGMLALGQALGRTRRLAQLVIGGVILGAGIVAYYYWFAWIYSVPKSAEWHGARSLWNRTDVVVANIREQENWQKMIQSQGGGVQGRRRPYAANGPYRWQPPTPVQGGGSGTGKANGGEMGRKVSS
jgi:hypothetical protein